MDDWRKKLDAYGRKALSEAKAGHGMDVTVRLADRDTSASILAEAGLEVQAELGDIVVGHVSERSALERIARLPCVAEIQMSRSLYPEKE